MEPARILSKIEIVEHYSRPEILKEMLFISRDREFCGAYREGNYHKRPNIIQFSSDIVQMARAGVTSFHCSVERWTNPMLVSTQTKNYNDLRKGFDFLIDIDSKLDLKASQICASQVCKLLRDYGIKNYGIKFSGRRGFHIIVPYEAFPQEINYQKTKDDYPRIPQILSGFIRDKLKDSVMEALAKEYTMKKLLEIVPSEDMNPYDWVDIEKGWGERHLFRAPYSFNEKTWLVSIPIKDPMEFDINSARAENVKTSEKFLKPCEENEALALLRDALNWDAKQNKEPAKKEEKKEIEFPTEKIGEEYFPPCIKEIFNGLEDGKKRSVFTLINFLRYMNWSWDEIEVKLMEWNAKNPKPLPNNFVIGQVNWNEHQKKRFPASCSSDLFYRSIGICKPDETCRKIKNPVTYPFKKSGSNLSVRKGKFFCRECSKDFKDEKSLITHQKRSHRLSDSE